MHQARQRVAQTRIPTPKQPTPLIPRLANPTGAQTHAALGMIRESQQRAVGRNPTPAVARRYQQEVLHDPRQRGFLGTVAHYLAASRRESGEVPGGLPISRQPNILQAAQDQLGLEGPQPELDAALKLAGNYASRGVPLARAMSRALSDISQAKVKMKQETERPRGSPSGLPTLAVSLPFLGTANITKGVEDASHLDLGVGGVPGKLLNEVVDFPAQTLLSGGMLGSGTTRAIEGHPGMLEHQGQEVVRQVTHPWETFKQAPISTALTLAGIEAGVGGAGGRLARTGVLGDTLQSIASTARRDLKLVGDERITGREYNPDPLRKGVQVANEKLMPRYPGRFRQADPFQATGRRLERAVVGGIVKPGRVDYAQTAGEHMHAGMVGGALEEAVRHTIKPKHGGAAQVPIFEGYVTHPELAPAQLAERLKNLQDAEKGLYPLTGPKVLLKEPKPLVGEDLAHNLKAQEAIKAAIAHPPTAETFAKTRQIVAGQRPVTAGRVALGGLDAEQLRASLFPYMQERMGARHYTVEDHAAAEAAASTPAARAAVSGRGDPQAVLDHERVIREHAEARSDVSKAQEDLRRAELAKSRVAGRKSVVGAPGTVKDRSAAAGGGDALAAADARVLGARERLVAANEHHQEARSAAAASKLPERQAGMRKANGEYLPTEEVLKHMQDHGVPTPGFLSHVAPRTRAGLFGTGRSRPTLESHQRTGTSFVNGTYDHSFGALLRQTQTENANLAAHMFENRKASRFDIGHGFQTKEAAQAYADNFRHTPEGKIIESGLGPLVPQTIAPKDILAKDVIETPHDAHAVLKQFGLSEHTPATEGQGQWTLRPQKINDRFTEHGNVRSRSKVGRAAEAWTQSWRRAKLYTSSRHFLGVAQELGIRLATESVAPRGIAGAHVLPSKRIRNLVGGRAADARFPETFGGRAGRTGAKFRETLDSLAQDKGPQGAKYRELAGILGSRGSLYTSSAARDIINQGDAWQHTSTLSYIRRGREASTESKSAQAALIPWRTFYHTLQKGMHRVEGQTYDAMLGKAVSEFFGGYRTVLKMQDDTMRQMIAGKLDSNTADALAHRVDDMMGNWSHLTPDVRQAVQKFTPFGLWWLNSMRWMYRLPVTHPVKLGIGAALYNATRQERNKEGQGFDAAHPVPAFLTGTLNATLPIVGKVKVNPTYYSPMGTAIEPGITAADMIEPAFSGIYSALKEQNPLTGAALTQRGNKPLTLGQSLSNVLGEIASGPTPGATQLQQLLQMSGKPYGTANILSDVAAKLGGKQQVKPGTERPLPEVLMKMLSPARFNFPGKTKTGGGTGVQRLPSDPIERQMMQEALKEAREHHGADPIEAQMRHEAIEEARKSRKR